MPNPSAAPGTPTQAVSIEHVLREALQLAAPCLPDDVQIFLEGGGSGLEAAAAPGPLRRALLLLIFNAIEAAGTEGRLTFGLSPLQDDGEGVMDPAYPGLGGQWNQKREMCSHTLTHAAKN